MIKFRCFRCDQKIAVPDDAVGKKTQCPHCRGILIIPAESAFEKPRGSEPNQSCDTSTSASRISPPHETEPFFRCPLCSSKIDVPENTCGQTVTCPRCESHVTVPIKVSRTESGREPSRKKPCPYCGEEILAVAIKCKHCGEFLSEQTCTTFGSPKGKAFYSPENMHIITTALDPNEALLELCDVTVVGTEITRTAVLTNRNVRFMGFGPEGVLVVHVAIPIAKVSTISVSETRYGRKQALLLTMVGECAQEQLVTEMVEAGRSFAEKLRDLAHCGYTEVKTSDMASPTATSRTKAVMFWLVVVAVILFFCRGILTDIFLLSGDEKTLVKMAKDLRGVSGFSSYELDYKTKAFENFLSHADVTQEVKRLGSRVVSAAHDVRLLKKSAENDSGSMGVGGAFVRGGMIGLAKDEMLTSVNAFIKEVRQ